MLAAQKIIVWPLFRRTCADARDWGCFLPRRAPGYLVTKKGPKKASEIDSY